MKKIFKLQILFLSLLLSSCNTSIQENILENNSQEKSTKNLNKEKEKMEIRFSCGEEGISDYTDNGWVIVKEYSEEKICTWKSFPATKECDMEKDKGCKITKPDKIGVEKIYLLEK